MSKKYIWLFITMFLISYSGTVRAATLTVDPACDTASDPTCFTTITAAISAANITTNDSIIVEPGTYTEVITLKNNLPISGRDTARTFLQSSGSQAVITANGLTSVNISKFTIVGASVGIEATNSTVSISNNIFLGNTTGTAIQLQGTSSGQIINNTFFQNRTAVSSAVDVTITNNVFSTTYGTALSAVSPLVAFTKVAYNDFHNNQNNGFVYSQTDPLATNIPNSANPASDPLFVDPLSSHSPKPDFHLQEGSPCIGTGTNVLGLNSFNGLQSDIGAFGGSGSDTIPFIISRPGITFSSPAADSLSVSWPPNNSYLVTNTNPALQGGYNVYYSFNKSGSLTNPYDNKVTVPSTDTSTLISGLTTTVPPPAAPVLNEPGFGNETLFLSWSLVPTATSYFLHYTDLVTAATNTISVGNTTSYALSGLVNGRNYSVTVSAVAQPVYHFSVTAFDYTVVSSSGGTPGVAHESAYLNPDLSRFVGTPSEGPLSTPVTAFPEAITPIPDLPNKGCFIATAAYGHYSAPQVQALREFRDRYLMTNRAGRAFVEWYYRYGPIGAEFMNTHEWLKPVVRTALMPAVGGALFMTRTSLLTKAAVLILAGILAGYLMQRRKHVHSGGAR